MVCKGWCNMHTLSWGFVTDLWFRPSNQHAVETNSCALGHFLGGRQELGEHGALRWDAFNIC